MVEFVLFFSVFPTTKMKNSVSHFPFSGREKNTKIRGRTSTQVKIIQRFVRRILAVVTFLSYGRNLWDVEFRGA